MAHNEGFFDNANEVALGHQGEGLGPTVSTRNTDKHTRSRRRPPSQPPVTFPSFDDELKEGTSLHDLRETRGGNGVNTDIAKREVPFFQEVEKGPRKIGSQFLDLDRGFTVNLAGMNEEIVALSAQDLKKLGEKLKSSAHTDLQGQLSDRIYVERNGKFYALSKKSEENAEQESKPITSDPIDPIKIYNATRTIFLFSHGMLAGFSLLHCICIWMLAPPHTSVQSFLETSTSMSAVLSTIYQFSIAISCVSCLCRIDLAEKFYSSSWSRHITSIVSTLFYLTAAILTHLCDVIAMRILLEFRDLRNITSVDFEGELTRWKILDLVRTVLVCCGWAGVSCSWSKDRMRSNLKSAFRPEK